MANQPAINTIVSGLPENLRARFDMIVQNVPKFWAQAPYRHFTNHGPAYSERVLNQKLAQLAQQLPPEQRLTPEEAFVVASAAWLYEIGMQSPRLHPILPFEYEPGVALSITQLQQIRAKKHLLSERLIFDSTSPEGASSLPLGLTAQADEYTQLIALVCRSCSSEPLDQIDEKRPIRGMPVRVRLLVALLRLADQIYLDSSRINWDLLQSTKLRAELPPEQLTQWWMHSYVQTLPIANNQIPFHYFLPDSQREYLGHIRGFVEGNFDHNKNPEIRFLFDHGVPLIPGRTPTVQFDQSQSFLRPMPLPVQTYLRDFVSPKEPLGVPLATQPTPLVASEALLIIDYENLLLQLGSQGRYPKDNEVDSLLLNLSRQFKTQTGSKKRALVFAHWGRADLVEAGRRLQPAIYERFDVDSRQNASSAIVQAVTDKFQQAGKPYQLVLVAPRDEFANLASDTLAEWKYTTLAWLVRTSEPSIYELAADETMFVDDLLQWSARDGGQPAAAADGETICLLCLNAIMPANSPGLSLAHVRSALEEEASLRPQVDWWLLKLLDANVLLPADSGEAGAFVLNRQHTAVQKSEQLRQAVLNCLSQAATSAGMAQRHMTEQLRLTDASLTETDVANLLNALKREEILYVRHNPREPNNPFWSLNARSVAVIAMQPERFLACFVLAFDHATMRSGFANILESRLARDLAPHFDGKVLPFLADLAFQKAWISRREANEQRRDGRGGDSQLVLATSHADVGSILRNRDIMLNILYYKTARAGLTKDNLRSRLGEIRAFSLPEAELDLWLDVLQRDKIVQRAVLDEAPDQVLFQLNTDSPLAQRLLGRLHLHALLRNLRAMRATGPDYAKPAGELLENLTRFVTNGDHAKAQWVLDYALVMRLAQMNGDNVFLNVQHSFVRHLDAREQKMCTAVCELVRSLPANKEGWVPVPLLLQRMDNGFQFGYSRSEQEYWLDQTIFRLRMLERMRTDDRRELVRLTRPR